MERMISRNYTKFITKNQRDGNKKATRMEDGLRRVDIYPFKIAAGDKK